MMTGYKQEFQKETVIRENITARNLKKRSKIADYMGEQIHIKHVMTAYIGA